MQAWMPLRWKAQSLPEKKGHGKTTDAYGKLQIMSHQLHKHLSKKQKTTLIDKLMSVACVIHPLTALPQVYIIYSTQDVTGVSLLTWFGFMILGAIFLAYGIVHRIKPFIVTQLLWFVIDFLIVFGVLIYR